MSILSKLPITWHKYLSDHTHMIVLPKLSTFLANECRHYTIYPPEQEWFSALEALSPEQVKVVILGQDPYHGAGQANGLAFSVKKGIEIPPSLRNIYKELQSDIGIIPSKTGNLMPWAQQGVLLMNTVLTVREASANSHKNQGWESLTEDIMTALGQQQKPLAFVLWGSNAKQFKDKIGHQHLIIESAHPSPLSAHRGFFGSKPFSQINNWLLSQKIRVIDWSL